MKNKIIRVLCEGQTEKGFVSEVLRPYLLERGVSSVEGILLTTNKKKNARGGLLSFSQVMKDLDLLRKECKDGDYQQYSITTMFDLYALPDDFPGYAEAQKIREPYARVNALEVAFANVVKDKRFIPYIQLYEFESLLFCGIEYIVKRYPNSQKLYEHLTKDLQEFGNPEYINNSPATAPSKRIIKAVEGEGQQRYYHYNKPSTGKYVTKEVGIEKLRTQCQHFNEWIEKLIDG